MKLTTKQKDKITTWIGATVGVSAISTSGDLRIDDILAWLSTADYKQIAFGAALWVAYFALFKD